MSNLFAMVTVKSSNFYTEHALRSFFRYTKLQNDDDFFLIDNDGCEIDKFRRYEKIKVIKNKNPLNFAENVNQSIKLAINGKKDLIFLTNDIIFTESWIEPLLLNSKNVYLPSNNQIFPYQSNCENLKLKITMSLEDFKENYNLLNDIVKKHKKKFKRNIEFQTLLMPFYCFKIPYNILCDVGYLDTAFGNGGGEDIDYRIRCSIKGYDVNFLLDSYLLHFHGKSTWGVETKMETEARNKKYTEVFLKKWGREITQIFIARRDFFEILEKREVKDLYDRGKFSDLIRKICKKK